MTEGSSADIRQSRRYPEHTDVTVVFNVSTDGTTDATVWRRSFPAGRQRRHRVAVYSLGDLGAQPSPADLLSSLYRALEEGPEYEV